MKRPARPLSPAEDNNTLRGRLYDYVREEDLPHRNRFGFWHMIESRMVREELIAAGHDPRSLGFFMLVGNRLEENHKNDHSPQVCLGYASKQAAIRQQAAFEQERMREEATDDCIEALRQIRDGHNDARALAAAVLAKLESL